MKELESPVKAPAPSKKVNPPVVRSPVRELKDMSTDELVRKLTSPEMSHPANSALRQQIIKILQEREGNAFVQRLIGKQAPGKSTG